ncbi:hypothetical protein B7755_015410 [Streptomyces sp. NBS 14/10]|uniref:hypothetical protein n=1 Tax=Streptomyces sp. NBS 14/10 TaxID=1945643 RepID=UPI000B7DCCBA|nr:hypothetical protein [Streptomyces sp. NBS 14/10]KAK1179411.1 hypothetical protein B7755_015410 [Streptomyces sp. NBS 14/10]
MNFGRTAALVAAAAGAVVFSGTAAGAVGGDHPVKQASKCGSNQALSFGGPPSRPDCVNFAKDIRDLTQLNNCDSDAGASGVSGSAALSSKLVEGSRCANVAVPVKSSKS